MKSTMQYYVGGKIIDVADDRRDEFLADYAKDYGEGEAPEEVYTFYVNGNPVQVKASRVDEFLADCASDGVEARRTRNFVMDDGQQLRLDETAARNFALAKHTGQGISSGLLKITGIPEQYGRSAADLEALAEAFGAYYPDDKGVNYDDPKYRVKPNIGDVLMGRRRNGGMLDYLQTQKEAEYGRELNSLEAVAANAPIVGDIYGANEKRKEAVLIRLYEGDYRDSLEASKLALSVGIPQEQVREINAAANGDADATRRGFADAVRGSLASIIETKRRKGAELSDFDLNFMQKAGAGAVGMVGTMAKMSNPLTASMTAGVDMMNRAADLNRGTMEVDEEGNPVRTMTGDGGDLSMLKGLGGSVAERAVWMTPYSKPIMQRIGNNIFKKNGAQIAEMTFKSDITDLIDNVIGLNRSEAEEKKDIGEWAKEHFYPKGLAMDLLETAQAHLTMKVGKLATKGGRAELVNEIAASAKEAAANAAAKETRRRVEEEAQREIKTARKEVARETYDQTMNEETAYQLDREIQEQIDAGTIPESARETVKSKVLSAYESKRSLDDAQLRENALLKAMGEVTTPTRVEDTPAVERRRVEANMRDNERGAKARDEYYAEEESARLAEIEKKGAEVNADLDAQRASYEKRERDIRAAFERGDNELVAELLAEQKAEMDAYNKAEAERKAREYEEENTLQPQEVKIEVDKPVEGESMEMRDTPEYKSWLKKNGRVDSDKNWNRYVAENELDPALRVDRGRNGDPEETWRRGEIKEEVESAIGDIRNRIIDRNAKDAKRKAREADIEAAFKDFTEPPVAKPDGNGKMVKENPKANISDAQREAVKRDPQMQDIMARAKLAKTDAEKSALQDEFNNRWHQMFDKPAETEAPKMGYAEAVKVLGGLDAALPEKELRKKMAQWEAHNEDPRAAEALEAAKAVLERRASHGKTKPTEEVVTNGEKTAKVDKETPESVREVPIAEKKSLKPDGKGRMIKAKKYEPSSEQPKDGIYPDYRYEVQKAAEDSFGKKMFDAVVEDDNVNPHPGGSILTLAQNIGGTSHFSNNGKVPSSKSMGEAVAEGWKKYGYKAWDHQAEIIEDAFARDNGRMKPVAKESPTPKKTLAVATEPTDEGFKAWAVDSDGKPMAFASETERVQSRKTFDDLVRRGRVDGKTGANIDAEAQVKEHDTKPKETATEYKYHHKIGDEIIDTNLDLAEYRKASNEEGHLANASYELSKYMSRGKTVKAEDALRRFEKYVGIMSKRNPQISKDYAEEIESAKSIVSRMKDAQLRRDWSELDKTQKEWAAHREKFNRPVVDSVLDALRGNVKVPERVPDGKGKMVEKDPVRMPLEPLTKSEKLKADAMHDNGVRKQIDDTTPSQKLQDPDFKAWAAKKGRVESDGARREYDAEQVDALGKHVTKNWIKGVKFRRTENAAEVTTGARMLYSRDGNVVGWYDSKAKEVVTLPGADASTVAHELGWHATYDHAKERAATGDMALLGKLNEYARKAKSIVVDPATGQTLKDVIEARYGQNGVTNPIALLDEIGAARYTMENIGKIKDAAARRQAAKWYERTWNAVADTYKSMLTKMGWNKARIDNISALNAEQTVELISNEMLKGRNLGETKALGIDMNKGESVLGRYSRAMKDYLKPLEALDRDAGNSVSGGIHTKMRLVPGKVQAAINEAEAFQRKLGAKMKESGVSVGELNEYMYAMAAGERNAKILRRNGSLDGSAMSHADIQRILTAYRNSPKYAELERMRQDVLKFQKKGFDERVRAGLIDRQTAHDLEAEEPNHVPMKSRFDADGNHTGFDSSATFGKPEWKKAEGRTNIGDGPLEWIMQEYVDAKSHAATNDARQSLLATVLAHPEMGTVKRVREGEAPNEIRRPGQEGDPNVVTVKSNGATYKITLNGTRGETIARAITGRGVKRVNKGLQNAARWFSSTATEWSPTFAGRNFIADTIDVFAVNTAEKGIAGGAVANAKHLFNAVKLVPEIRKYVKTGETNDPVLREAIEAGVLMGGGIRSRAFQGDDYGIRTLKTDFAQGKNRAKALGKTMFGWVNTLNQTAEMMNRMADYKLQREAGKSKAEAALHAREITVDFNQKGELTPWTNTAYMFSNSALGSTMRLNKALFASKHGWQLAAGTFALGLIEGFGEATMNGDDEDGKNVNEYTRANSIYIRNGKDIYRIPMHASPISLIKYAGNCAARKMMGTLGKSRWTNQVADDGIGILSQFAGVGNVGDNKAAGIAPTLIQPFVQAFQNRDFADRPIEKTTYSENQPKSHNGRTNTPELYKEIAKALNAAGGGNEARRGSVNVLGKDISTDVSPEMIKHFVEAIGKNTLRDVENVENMLEVAFGKSEADRRNVPGVRDYYRTAGDNDDRFFKAYGKYKADSDELRDRTKWGDGEKAEYLKERPWLYKTGSARTIDRWVSGHSVDGRHIPGINDLRKMEQGQIRTKSGKFVPHEWSKDKVEEFKKRRIELQKKVIEKMGG